MATDGLDGVPDALRYAFETAVFAALCLPAIYLWAGKVDLQVGGTPEAYLLRTALLTAAGLLVVAALFVPVLTRRLWPRYVHGFLLMLYGLGAFKAALDVVITLTDGARTIAGAPGAPGLAWLPVWFVEVVAVFLNIIVLWWLVQPEARDFVSAGLPGAARARG